MLTNEAIKMMIKKLKVECDAGRIDNEWSENFINEMYDKTKLNYYPFSEKQATKIEELFNKY